MPAALVIGATIAPGEIPAPCERVHGGLERSGTDELVGDGSALTRPDAIAVEALARLQITAMRLGRRIVLTQPPRRLQELLVLCGLCEALPVAAGSALEPGGQAEEREQ